MAKRKTAAQKPPVRVSKHRRATQIASPYSPDERLLEYLRSLDERTLHLEVVYPLFRAMHLTHVEYVHGSFEKGKDLKFIAVDTFNKNILGVCQVKNEAFSGNALSSSNTTGVLVQLTQCKHTAIINPITNRNQTPDTVWLITTYPLPDKDMLGASSLADSLAGANIRVVWPDELVSLIKNKMESFYDRHAAHGQIISHRLREYLDHHHEATAFDTVHTRRLSQFFVNLVARPRHSILNDIRKGRLVILEPQPGLTVSRDEFHSIQEAFSIVRLESFSLPFLDFTESEAIVGTQKQGRGANARTSYVRINRVRIFELLKNVAQRLQGISRITADIERAQAEADGIRLLCTIAYLLNLLHRIFRDALFSKAPCVTCHSDAESIFLKALKLKTMNPAALLQLQECLVIAAGAGAGKTSLARMVAVNGLASGQQVCYFPCARHTDSTATLRDSIIRFLVNISPGVSYEDAQHYLDGSELVLLDGCDEASNFGRALADEIRRLAWKSHEGSYRIRGVSAPCPVPTLLRSAAEYNGKTKELIVHEYLMARERELLLATIELDNAAAAATVRTGLNDAGQRIIAFTRPSAVFKINDFTDRLQLRRFTKPQLKEFFGKWFDASKVEWDDLWSFLEKNERILQVCRTPIVATIVGALYEKDRHYPKTRTEVYIKRFDLLLSKWDTARNVRRHVQVSPHDKRLLLTELAFWLHMKHRREFSVEQFSTIWARWGRQGNSGVGADEILEELRVCNSVVIQESQRTYTLGHLSFQEFLCAEAIVRRQHIQKLAKRVLDPWWAEVCKFVVGIVGDATILIRAIQQALPCDPEFLQALRSEARFSPAATDSFIDDMISDDK